MNFTKNGFIELALTCKVLKFGEFTLKSGRKSPYFFNAGLFYTGQAIHQLGGYYADLIIKNQLDFEHLFGPAYKGIPLAAVTAAALAEQGKNCTVTFNRKEAKDHGEGGLLIGAPLHGNTVIIDDVITAGTAFREAQQMIQANGGQVKAAVLVLDRCERGLTEKSSIQEIRAQGIEVYSIITLFDLIDYLKAQGETELVAKMLSYHKEYGV